MRRMLNRFTALVRIEERKVERGDVPGWVMITLMTAALVVLIWSVAGPALTSLFENAIQRVTQM
ncbi:hypothetical protein J2S49_001570 [Arcanobacterium wilhelmae]|uniref:Uncharacterized protein n=1 Tax=Arcanobacterium wilhelmae TaxID=1803177 RepID=A0ABT9NCP2_9ACTO|nr:hypothetical protein [Arcanobacterium wilhelmae]MDP9801494.1 hypothetical protein [Arcanobacterium wilhelmae]WFN90825.1 hypothetical protein P8A24_02920 [Arcanobacterium wilhelmae]